ncbi:MAG: LPD1 domain-containing protein [Owenweeksia sp.]
MKGIKIQDTLTGFTRGSRVDRYWTREGVNDFYRMFRKGASLPKEAQKMVNNTEMVAQKFHLRGFQFGNWLSLEDRFNYLAALYICLLDFNRVLRFKGNNLGLDHKLGVSFGARGRSKAVAHFESWSNIINITRYARGDRYPASKDVRFVNSGGTGSFAHEYGHFLDYYLGGHYERERASFPLTAGVALSRKRIHYPDKWVLRNITEDILAKAYWKDEKKRVKSNYMVRLERKTDRDYFFRRNEVFARLFEQFTGQELQSKGINNLFLTEQKYNSTYYLTPQELKTISPLFRKFLKQVRTYF